MLLHSVHQIHTHLGILHKIASISAYEHETNIKPLSVALFYKLPVVLHKDIKHTPIPVFHIKSPVLVYMNMKHTHNH